MLDLLLEVLFWALDIALSRLGVWDRTGRFLGYVIKCLEAARDWVEECIRERKITEP